MLLQDLETLKSRNLEVDEWKLHHHKQMAVLLDQEHIESSKVLGVKGSFLDGVPDDKAEAKKACRSAEILAD